MPKIRLSEIVALIGGTITGSEDPEITGVSGIREAGPGHLTFLAHPRYSAYMESTRATAVIVPEGHGGGDGPLLVRAADPYSAFLKAIRLFGQDRPECAPGIHPSAIVDPAAKLGQDVSIGAAAVVEAGVVLEDRVVIMAGVFVGRDAVIGEDTFIYPNVTIREKCRLGRRVIVHPGAVIGSDGFGFVSDGGSRQKVPQVGIVEVLDDVEIGANTTIDRATTGVTRIGKGVKIDNLVQVGHNVVIGENSVVCAQVGISGSTEVGRDVTLAGQAGLVGHIRIGDGTLIGAQAGVTKSIPARVRVSGYPAAEHESALKVQALTRKLPELFQIVRDLRARIDELEKELEKAREKV